MPVTLESMDARPTSSARHAEILLPAAAGLMLVAVRHAVSSEPIAAGIVVATVLTLGALLHDHPWRTAAIAVLPGVGVSLVKASSDSFGHVALVALTSPLVVIVAGLLVKGGGLLVHRPDPHDAPVQTSDEPLGGRRRKPLDTKAQRARLLVVLLVIIVVGGGFLSKWGSGEADRLAARRVVEIHTALAGRSLDSIRLELLKGSYGAPAAAGGPYVAAAPGPDRFDATAEVHSHLQYRCIHVRVTAAGDVSTQITHARCG